MEAFFLKKKLFVFLFFLFWFFSINLGTLIFETVYRDNTIYFPVNYNLLNIKDNPFSQVQYDWDWSNGRWVGALLQITFLFKNVNTVSDLQILKILCIWLNIIAAFIYFNFLHKLKPNNIRNLVISLGIFSLPGFIYWNFGGIIIQFITLIITVIIGFYFHELKNKIALCLFYILSFFCFTIYPPIFFLILIFPVSIILFDNKNFSENFYIFKKYLYLIFFSATVFLIFKTFIIEHLYNFIHGNLINIYPFFFNDHSNYSTKVIFGYKFFLKIIYKIYLYITIWLKADINFWNLYTSWVPVLIFFLLLYLLFKKRIMITSGRSNISKFSYKELKKILISKNASKYYFIIILYFLPILIWLPLNSELIAYRITMPTTAIVFIILIYILENFRSSRIKFYFYILIFFSFSFSIHNSLSNAKNAHIEFAFVTEKLKQVDKTIKHIHIIQPEVGYGYNGLESINEEFNRPSLLTWQENTRYLQAASSQIENFNFIFHDCETKVYIDKNYNFPIYKVSFPKKWNFESCLKNLMPNSVLVTFSHPHRYVDQALNNQDHLNIRSRYIDLTDQSYEDSNYKVPNYYLRADTLIINLSEIQKKVYIGEKKISWERKLYRKIFSN